MAKQTSRKSSSNAQKPSDIEGKRVRDAAQIHDQTLARGGGGELHQTVEDGYPVLTTAQGGPVSDDQNSVRVGPRGPQAPLFQVVMMPDKLLLTMASSDDSTMAARKAAASKAAGSAPAAACVSRSPKPIVVAPVTCLKKRTPAATIWSISYHYFNPKCFHQTQRILGAAGSLKHRLQRLCTIGP